MSGCGRRHSEIHKIGLIRQPCSSDNLDLIRPDPLAPVKLSIQVVLIMLSLLVKIVPVY